MENFDDEVREKLKMRQEKSAEERSRFEQLLLAVTQHELADRADFAPDGTFQLRTSPVPDRIPVGRYELPRRTGESHLYRLGHPLAEWVIGQAKGRALEVGEIQFDRSAHAGRIAALDPLVDCSGWLSASMFSVRSFDRQEDHIILVGTTDAGANVDATVLPRLLRLPSRRTAVAALPSEVGARLRSSVQRRRADLEMAISERNAKYFDEETSKLEGWADDMKLALERELKELDKRIKEIRRSGSGAATLEERLAVQRAIRALESERNEKRKRLFDAQDEVDRRRGELIEAVEAKLRQESMFEDLFTIRWSLLGRAASGGN